MKRLPKFLKKYFWDVDFGKLEFTRQKVYILKRLLNYGDEKAVGWMFKKFKESEIRSVLANFRGYSRKSANFWAFILNLPRQEVLCLKKRLSKEPKIFWPY